MRRCIVNANTGWWRRRPWREQPSPLVPDRPGRGDLAGDIAARDVVLRALDRLTRRGMKAPGGQFIVWLECARKPVPRFPVVTPPAG